MESIGISEFRCGTCEEGEQPAIKAYYFRMVKKGNGWKTDGFFTRDTDKIPPIAEWSTDEPIPLRYATLSKIKQSFSECTPLTYVIDGHLSAPSDIYQVVVKFHNTDDWNEREALWKGTKKSLCYDIHYEYKYVSDVPKKVIANWTSF
jgi:hypothetical protein